MNNIEFHPGEGGERPYTKRQMRIVPPILIPREPGPGRGQPGGTK